MIKLNTIYELNLQTLFSENYNYCLELLHDGRFVSHLTEKILEKTHSELTFINESYRDFKYEETNGYNVFVECKCLTKHGCDLSPSYMKGSGRTIDKEKFKEISSNQWYVIVDVRPENYIFPYVFIEGKSLTSNKLSQKEKICLFKTGNLNEFRYSTDRLF